MSQLRSFVLAFAVISTLFTNIAPAHAETAPPLTGDALYPPRSTAATRATSLGGTPDRYAPSAFLAGRVAVRLVLVESDGSTQPSSEDWSDAQRTTVENHVHAALDWWAARLPNANLSFVLTTQLVSSRYEPITQNLNNERLWVGDVFSRLGFNGNSHFDQAYSADDALRREQKTDWATTIFVVDSDNDPDGAFADGQFAYAYVGGPFLVITSDAGAYGTGGLPLVIAHEFGHIFGALDQYEVAGTPCTMKGGYLAIPTTNSQANGCGTKFPSIMWNPVSSFPAGAVDDSALGQVGYRDSNGNGIPDPLDTTPALQVSLSQQSSGRPQITARANDQPFPSPTQRAVSINTLKGVEYRVDDGEWTLLAPADGQYDSVEEAVNTTLPLYDGTHHLEFRAVNRVGASSTITTQTVVVSNVGAAPSYTLEVPALSNNLALPIHVQAPAGYEASVSSTPSFANATWTPVQHLTSYQLPATDGEHVVYIVLRDQRGIETPMITRTVLIDRQAPTGQARIQGGAQPELIIDAKDELSGLEAMQFEASPDNMQSWQPFSSVIGLFDRSVPTQIRLRDRAGNVSAPLNIQQSHTTYIPLTTRM